MLGSRRSWCTGTPNRSSSACSRPWPDDLHSWPLIVVDNGSDHGLRLPAGATLIAPGRNLGFGGAINAALDQVESPLLLILNPDAQPEPGSLELLVHGFDHHEEMSGLAPKLIGRDGESQHRWQLRTLPTGWQLLRQTLFLGGTAGGEEPASGTAVEQPAAAALALRRDALAEVGGFDGRFYPAWFEDVDLAVRLEAAGHRLGYLPEARFRHTLGSTVPTLGYGAFLYLYYRNLLRYIAKHHGPGLAMIARCLLPLTSLAVLITLPVRCPRRASSRGDAARGLLGLALAAATGWRRPARLQRRFSPRDALEQST